MEQFSNQRGSALLISILLMSFVIVFGLGISSLIVDSVRVETNVIEAGKAYFAAEGGVEEALYWHENALPGYSPTVTDYDLLNGATMSYDLVASGSTVPCSHRDEWRTLSPSESVSLPLFYGDDVASRTDVTEFEVEYELDYGAYESPNPYDYVLRWKVLGLDSDDFETESVSEVQSYDPNNPVDLTQDTLGSHYDQDGPPFVNDSTYPISTFLGDHILNYLVLMNLTDLDLNFRLSSLATSSLTNPLTTCEYALIEADGFSHGAKQSIDVQVKLDSFLPVFDFVLYQTD